tara:strand:+ start:141275 stop:141592 length:318 start_codon:yes stop_codon:yes gene_type:complete
MKNIFKAVSKYLDEAFFQPPRHQLSLDEKNLMADSGYKVTRTIATLPVMGYAMGITIPTIEFDLVSHADGEQLNSEEYKVVDDMLDSYRNAQQGNAPKPTGNVPK